MSFSIRRADLEADADQMIKLLTATVNPRYDRDRFEWLYRRNPDGPAAAWVMIDGETGELVGTAAAVPRRVRIDGEIGLSWALSDFAVAGRYRALGPALQLQRACLAEVASGQIQWCYDFPSVGMMAVYRRLAVEPAVRVRRYAGVLRVDRAVSALGLPSSLGRPAAAVGNALLRLTLRAGSASDLDVGPDSRGCGDEFDQLDKAYAREHAVRTSRGSDYLHWRFLSNPFQGYEIITARRGGRLVAYLVVTTDRVAPVVAEILGPGDGRIIGALLRGTVSLLRSRGAETLSMVLNERHPWVATLEGIGLRARESHPVMVYGPKAPVATMNALASPGSLLMSGDWDI